MYWINTDAEVIRLNKTRRPVGPENFISANHRKQRFVYLI